MKEIINIILDEADIAIEDAYKEGYKKATLDYKPEIAYYQELYKSTKKEKNNINIVVKSLCLGFTSGIITTIIFYSLIKN